MQFEKTMHNKMMSTKMSKAMAPMMKFMGNKKKMQKAMKARHGGKGESMGEGE